MGYRIVIGGVPIECDSIDEALALAQRAGGAVSDKPQRIEAVPTPSGNSRWTEARMKEMFGHLKGNQRRLVEELLDHPEGRTDEQLLTAFGLKDGRELGGVFTGLWKNAKKVGADPSDVYQKQSITIADRRGYEYTLSESFRRMAEKVRTTVTRR